MNREQQKNIELAFFAPLTPSRAFAISTIEAWILPSVAAVSSLMGLCTEFVDMGLPFLIDEPM